MITHLKQFALLLPILILFDAQAQRTNEARLERKLAYPDSTIFLPFTLLAHIENAALPEDYSGWVMESDFKKSNDRSVIILEMNSSDLMDYKYSSGSVQLIIEFPQTKKTTGFDLNSRKLKVHQINNYGGINAKQLVPKGKISIEKLKDKLKITGDIVLETEKSYTKQVIHLNNSEFVSFSLKGFILAREALEIIKEIDYETVIEAITDSLMNDTTAFGESTSSAIEVTDQQSDTTAFDFKLVYNHIGLGSNQFYPSRIKIEIRDSILSYGIMELSDEIEYIDYATGDTTFKEKRIWYQVPFPTASRDSIVLLLKPMEGKDLSIFNPNVMSGAINEIYIEYNGICSKISMKNAFDETANQLYKIIDNYIPEEYHLHGNPDSWFKESDYYRSTTDCTGNEGKTKKQFLEDEYDAIRNK